MQLTDLFGGWGGARRDNQGASYTDNSVGKAWGGDEQEQGEGGQWVEGEGGHL